MTADRLSVSLNAELSSAVRGAAEEEGLSPSAWLAEAARRRLSGRGILKVVAEYEAMYGPFTEEELADARRELGK